MAGILGPLVRLVIFFLCFCCAVAAAAVACSFAGASLARVLLGSGVSRTSAGCARGFYNPLQRRHREGAVPGLRTRQSWCTAPQLNQLLATVSFHQHSHLAFCGYLLWESSSRAPHTLREGAPGSLGVTEPDGVCRLNEPRNRRICERAVRMIDTQLPARAPRQLCRGACLWLWESGKCGGDVPALRSGPLSSPSVPRARPGCYRGEVTMPSSRCPENYFAEIVFRKYPQTPRSFLWVDRFPWGGNDRLSFGDTFLRFLGDLAPRSMKSSS